MSCNITYSEYEILEKKYKKAVNCLSAMVYWHYNCNDVDKSWWEEAREIVKSEDPNLILFEENKENE
jgi:hypothetical protein